MLSCLIATVYEVPKWLLLTATGALIFTLFIFDWALYATRKTGRVFYIPLAVELAFLTAGILIWIFSVPERWFDETRMVMLYLSSWILYSVILISFLFEMHNILYYTLRLNSGHLDDVDEWWKIANIYN